MLLTLINDASDLFKDKQSMTIAYLNTKVSVVKKAIDKLPADVLQKLGISITSNSLEAFIKLTDDEVQKLIEAMIKESAKVAE